jgi:hypothetical protein
MIRESPSEPSKEDLIIGGGVSMDVGAGRRREHRKTSRLSSSRLTFPMVSCERMTSPLACRGLFQQHRPIPAMLRTVSSITFSAGARSVIGGTAALKARASLQPSAGPNRCLALGPDRTDLCSHGRGQLRCKVRRGAGYCAEAEERDRRDRPFPHARVHASCSLGTPLPRSAPDGRHRLRSRARPAFHKRPSLSLCRRALAQPSRPPQGH